MKINVSHLISFITKLHFDSHIIICCLNMKSVGYVPFREAEALVVLYLRSLRTLAMKTLVLNHDPQL